MHPHTHAVRAPHHHSDQKKRDLTEHAKITTAGTGEGKTDGPQYGWKPKAATRVKGKESVKQQRNAAIMNIIFCGNRWACL